MRRAPRILGALAGTAALVLAGACTSEEDGSGTDGDVAEVDQVVYVTNFGLLGREAHAIVALEMGFFEEQGIDVEIEPGSGTEDNLALLLGGQAQFTAVDIAGAIISIGEGVEGFRVTAAIQQDSPAAIMAVDPDIVAPRDLEGRVVGGPPGGIITLLFPVYAELAGVDPESVTMEAVAPPQLPVVLAGGQVDAIGQFAVGLPLIQNAVEGEDVTIFPYSDYLTDLYGVGLVTTDELIEENPDLVQRFQTALLQGLEYALENPDEAGEIFAAFAEGQPAPVAAAELRLMEPYARPADAGVEIGDIDPQRLAQSIAILEAAGAVPPGLSPEDIAVFDLTAP